jgi:cytochrome d ubiquinol oxidase subunit II
MRAEYVVLAIMVAALVFYVLFGGADFGGGVWDLFASGPRKHEQRALIERAISPVWETNHIWFIFVFVLLFSAFPTAFAQVTTSLFGILTAYAVGLVLRGAAFTFRHYERTSARRKTFGAIFSVASIACPFLLGMMGALLVRDRPMDDGVLTPLTVASGVFVLALVASLAATYLTVEAAPTLAGDFRKRALASLIVAGAASSVALAASHAEAPRLFRFVIHAGPLGLATLLGAASILLLVRTRFRLARVSVAALTTTAIVGWALAKGEILVPPSLTISMAKAHPATLHVLIGASLGGAALLLPSLWLLFRIFAPPRSE